MHTDPLKVKDAGEDQPSVCYHVDMDPAAWDADAFGISFKAVHLYEAMPAAFTFDELIDQASQHGLSTFESVDLLRVWQGCEMDAFDEWKAYPDDSKPAELAA